MHVMYFNEVLDSCMITSSKCNFYEDRNFVWSVTHWETSLCLKINISYLSLITNPTATTVIQILICFLVSYNIIVRLHTLPVSDHNLLQLFLWFILLLICSMFPRDMSLIMIKFILHSLASEIFIIWTLASRKYFSLLLFCCCCLFVF